MGYTHYWTFKQPTMTARAVILEARYQRAVVLCNRMIHAWSKQFGGLAGYSAHTLGKYSGTDFNGSRENGHENFVLREMLHLNESFNFCKTAQKPYDTLVKACLLILKSKLGDAIEISSDGNVQDWIAGLALAKQSTGLKRIYVPDSIRDHKQGVAV